MQHQRARSLEHVHGMASSLETDAGNKIVSFLFILAGLIVDQHKVIDSGPMESRRRGKSMTDELGECIIHLIREAGKQGIPLPVHATNIRGGRKPAVTVRYAGTSHCYWVDVFDQSAEMPLMYNILVKTYSSEAESDGPRRNDLDAAGGC